MLLNIQQVLIDGNCLNYSTYFDAYELPEISNLFGDVKFILNIQLVWIHTNYLKYSTFSNPYTLS